MPISEAEGFDRIAKHLDIVPSRECPQGTGQTRTIDHPYNISPSRDIKKLHYQINVPKLVFAVSAGHSKAFIRAQYNYTAPRDFRIVWDSDNNELFTYGFLCAKYRTGTTVFRYFLGGRTLIIPDVYAPDGRSRRLDPVPGWNMCVAEVYTNQLIKKNFVIEFWQPPRVPPFAAPFFSMSTDVNIKTSLLRNPLNVDESSIFFNAGAYIEPTLYTAFPEPIPTDNTDNAWLTN